MEEEKMKEVKKEIVTSFLKISLDSSNIFHHFGKLREKIYDDLDDEYKKMFDDDDYAFDNVLRDVLNVVYEDPEDSDYDIVTILPIDYKAVKKVLDALILSMFDNIIDDTQLTKIMLKLYHKELESCLESGTEWGLYVKRILENNDIKPIKVEGDEKCYKSPYECSPIFYYPKDIVLKEIIYYCNECYNSNFSGFIEKCHFWKLANEKDED